MGTVMMKIDSRLEEQVTSSFPRPLAEAYDKYCVRLYEALAERGTRWENVIHAQRELIDMTFIFTAILAICDYVQSGYGDESFRSRCDEMLKELWRPSTGSWAKFLTKIPDPEQADLEQVIVPSFFGLNSEGTFASLVEELSHYRNDLIHDRLPDSIDACERMVQTYHPKLEQLLGSLRFLGNYEFCFVDSTRREQCQLRAYVGIRRPRPQSLTLPGLGDQAGIFLWLHPESGRFLNLHPFVRLCEDCKDGQDVLIYKNRVDEKRLQYSSEKHEDGIKLPGTLDLLSSPKVEARIRSLTFPVLVDRTFEVEIAFVNKGNMDAPGLIFDPRAFSLPSELSINSSSEPVHFDLPAYKKKKKVVVLALNSKTSGKLKLPDPGMVDAHRQKVRWVLESFAVVEAPTPPNLVAEMRARRAKDRKKNPTTSVLTVSCGDIVEVQINLKNLGNTPAQEVQFKVELPEGVAWEQRGNLDEQGAWNGSVPGYARQNMSYTVRCECDTGRIEWPLLEVTYQDEDGQIDASSTSDSVALRVSPSIEVPLINRDEVQERLRRAIDEVLTGRSQVVFLEGEMGVGKSKLTQHLQDEMLSPERFQILPIECPERGYPAGVRLVLCALFGVHDHESEDQITKRLRQFFEHEKLSWEEEIPSLAAFLAREQIDGQQRELFLQVWWHIVTQIARRRPVAIVLDDLHWADSLTLSWLKELERYLNSVENLYLLMVATFRPEGRSKPELRDLLSNFARGGEIYHVYELHRLDQASTHQWVSQVFRGLEAEGHAIHDKTDGLGFLINHLLCFLRDGDLLEPDSKGSFRLKQGVNLQALLPKAIQEIIGQRLAQVDKLSTGKQLRSVLDWCSVIGLRGNYEVLEKVMCYDGEATSAQEIEDLLDQLLELGFLKVEILENEQVVVSLDHAMLRDEIYRVLAKNPLRMRRLHARVAEVMEEVYAERRSEVITELGRHYKSAGEKEKAFECLLAAGERARLQCAMEEAVGYYRQARQLIDLEVRIAEILQELKRADENQTIDILGRFFLTIALT